MTNETAYILFTRLSQAADEEALTLLHDRFFYRLYKLALSITGDRGAAEEIANDVFLHLWQRREQLYTVRHPDLYMLKSARNGALCWLRAQRPKASRIEIHEDDLHDFSLQYASSPEQILISSEMVRHINQVIDQLAPKCKLIFLLVKESNLKYKEVAQLLDISIKTVEAQMSIALKRISLSVPLVLAHH